MSKLNVCLITSVPMVPPWDQGDKNLAYSLATAMPDIQFRIFTSQGTVPPHSINMDFEPLYPTANPSLIHKTRIYVWLLKTFLHSIKIKRDLFDDSSSVLLQDKKHRFPNPDLYHLIYRPFRLSSLLFRFLPEFKRRPTLHTVPATADGYHLSRKLFFSDYTVVFSDYGRRELTRLGLKNVIHIPSGVDTQKWGDLIDRTDQYKAALALDGHPVVLFPGHYGPGQGADIVLESLPTILAKVPETIFIFACRLRSKEDHYREIAAHQWLERNNLLHAVRFYNTVQDMRTLIGASDFAILPLQTMRDKIDIPTTLVETMAAAKPVIISDIPPMNEIIHCGENYPDPVGFVTPPGDYQALARSALKFICDEHQRRRSGLCAREMVIEHFDIQHVAHQYAALYRKILH